MMKCGVRWKTCVVRQKRNSGEKTVTTWIHRGKGVVEKPVETVDNQYRNEINSQYYVSLLQGIKIEIL